MITRTIAIEGNGIRPSHKGLGYSRSEKMYTLNTIEIHKVAYSFDVRFTSEGTRNARGTVYETDTSRTLDTAGNAPDSNQGGVAVVLVMDKNNESLYEQSKKAVYKRIYR